MENITAREKSHQKNKVESGEDAAKTDSRLLRFENYMKFVSQSRIDSLGDLCDDDDDDDDDYAEYD